MDEGLMYYSIIKDTSACECDMFSRTCARSHVQSDTRAVRQPTQLTGTTSTLRAAGPAALLAAAASQQLAGRHYFWPFDTSWYLPGGSPVVTSHCALAQ